MSKPQNRERNFHPTHRYVNPNNGETTLVEVVRDCGWMYLVAGSNGDPFPAPVGFVEEIRRAA